MLPRLQAEETLDRAQSAGLGFGGGEEGTKAIAALQRAAKGEKVLPESRKVTGRQFAASLGIPIKVKKKKE